jgi:tetratricopeptide (TPR) repeat protein
MNLSISNLTKIAIATLTIFPITSTLNISSAHAELSQKAIDSIANISSLNSPYQTKIAQLQVDNSEGYKIAGNPDLSMRYVGLGWAAQKRGEDSEALIYYRQAIELDETNAVAFMALGTLLDKFGKTEEAITSVKVALILFATQDNKEGQDLGMSWLEAHGVNK